MKTKLPVICFALLFCSGCGSDACVNGPLTDSLSSVQMPLIKQSLMGDELGAKAYDEIADKKLRHEPIRIDIYSLEAENTFQNLIENRHLEQPRIEENQKFLWAKNGNTECSWNKNSAYEFCFDSQRFETSPGVDKSKIQSDEFYIQVAENYLKQNIVPQITSHFNYYPYKRKYGLNGGAPVAEPWNITETVYEVGVAFASSLDGWPVIGPGGKIYIHIMPEGDIIAHKTYRKYPQKSIARLTENDLKSPDEALAELEKQIDLNNKQIVRREFGYYYKGKNSIQNILSPYYVFFFSPTNSQFDTVNYYFVSAVKGDLAQIIEKDNNLELNRKRELIQNTSEPDEVKK